MTSICQCTMANHSTVDHHSRRQWTGNLNRNARQSTTEPIHRCHLYKVIQIDWTDLNRSLSLHKYHIPLTAFWNPIMKLSSRTSCVAVRGALSSEEEYSASDSKMLLVLAGPRYRPLLVPIKECVVSLWSFGAWGSPNGLQTAPMMCTKVKR